MRPEIIFRGLSAPPPASSMSGPRMTRGEMWRHFHRIETKCGVMPVSILGVAISRREKKSMTAYEPDQAALLPMKPQRLRSG